MPVNSESGKKAAETNKRLYGADFYSRIGTDGGKKGRGHSFGHGKVDPIKAGQKGGKISKRLANKAKASIIDPTV